MYFLRYISQCEKIVDLLQKINMLLRISHKKLRAVAFLLIELFYGCKIYTAQKTQITALKQEVLLSDLSLLDRSHLVLA